MQTKEEVRAPGTSKPCTSFALPGCSGNTFLLDSSWLFRHFRSSCTVLCTDRFTRAPKPRASTSSSPSVPVIGFAWQGPVACLHCRRS